jgi:hypothetical protein
MVAIEQGLSITDPANISVKRVYKYQPRQGHQITDMPCFTHNWSFTELLPRELSLHWRNYTVRMQFFCAKAGADDERNYDVATAFWEVTLDTYTYLVENPAVDIGGISLGGLVLKASLRGGEAGIDTLTWAEQPYIGWEAFLDVQIPKSWQIGG